MRVIVGQRLITCRRGRNGPILREHRSNITMDSDRVIDLLGDEKARVHKGLTLGESAEIRNGTWLNGKVITMVTLTCDQDEDVIKEADKIIWELVQESTLNGVDWLHSWIEDIKG